MDSRKKINKNRATSSGKPPKMSAQELSDSGLVFEINRLVLHPVGLSLVTKGNSLEIIDKSFLPEGLVYTGKEMEQGNSQVRGFRVNKGANIRLGNRMAKYGFIVQQK